MFQTDVLYNCSGLVIFVYSLFFRMEIFLDFTWIELSVKSTSVGVILSPRLRQRNLDLTFGRALKIHGFTSKMGYSGSKITPLCVGNGIEVAPLL